MLIRLIDLVNRPYATRSTPMEDQWGWILSRTAERFDCDVDDVSSIEDEDGDELLVVRGEPVARISKDYGMGATIQMSREIKQAERPDSVKVLPSNFTPGPWTIEEYGDNDTPNLVIHEDSESRICFMATPGSHGDPAIIEANARLIAAAPDLLAALQGIVEIHGGLGVSMQVAIAAIAKATGTS